jgi:hypothetical protein
MENTAKICSRVVEFEERASSLYLELARRFRDKSQLSWFWLEMSMAERQHALLLHFCACENMVREGLPDKNAIEKLANLFKNLEKRAGQKDVSVDDAFLIAAELEGSEINDIYAGVIGPVHGTSHIMKKKIETLIPDHVQSLIHGARKFGVSPATVARMVEITRAEADRLPS